MYGPIEAIRQRLDYLGDFGEIPKLLALYIAFYLVVFVVGTYVVGPMLVKQLTAKSDHDLLVGLSVSQFVLIALVYVKK